MKDLMDKLSNYNIFNYLLPGVIFVVILPKISNYNLIQKDYTIGVFLYYFIGLVISRFGSVIIEYFLKKINFVNFSEYKKYVFASKNDSKIELFSEINNMYRTLLSTLILLILASFYSFIEDTFTFLEDFRNILLVITLMVLFLFSYKKQIEYIKKRVDNE